MKSNIKNIIFKNDTGLGTGFGDLVCMTALVRDIHKTYPGRFKTDVRTLYNEVWHNNPYLTSIDEHESDTLIAKVNCNIVNDRIPCHIIYTQQLDFNGRFGLNIMPNFSHGDLHLSEKEKSEPPFNSKPYWLLVAGGKQDMTCKVWPTSWYQQVVDAFSERIQFVQVGRDDHLHAPLDNVINMVGKTTIREAITLSYFADGIVCPITSFMHLAASFQKPCVVLGGGMESLHYIAYPGQTYLNSLGYLDCCNKGGCYKYKVSNYNSQCAYPISIDEQGPFAKCMIMIHPSKIIESIERYVSPNSELISVETQTNIPKISVNEVILPKANINLSRYKCEDGGISFQELVLIATLVKKANPSVLLEIGTFNGITSINIAANISEDSRLYTIDLPKGIKPKLNIMEWDSKYIDEPKHSQETIKNDDNGYKIVQIYGDSAEYDFSKFVNNVDFIFIDGSHSYEYVKSDTLIALRLVKKGGTIVWHDYGTQWWPGVTRAIEEIWYQNGDLKIKRIEGTSLCYCIV